MKIKSIIFLGLALALSLGALCLGCNEPDDVDAMSKQISGGSSSAPPPADTATPAPPADGAAAPTPDAAAGDDAAAAPAAPEPDANPKAEPPAVGEEPAPGESAKEPAAKDEGAKSEDESVEPAPGADDKDAGEAKEGDGEAKSEGEAAGEGDDAAAGEEPSAGEAAEEELDPIARFEVLDPRDIIEMKYDDLEKKQSTPTDPDSDWYNERIGRVDPLTRVRSEVPDELRPPRAGESDQNEINTYLIAQAATEIVTAIAYSMQCDSVLQIGLEKQAIFILPDGTRRLFSEGSGFEFGAGFIEGIALVASVSCSSINTDEVVLSITCYGQNTPTAITKNQVYIPRGFGG